MQLVTGRRRLKSAERRLVAGRRNQHPVKVETGQVMP